MRKLAIMIGCAWIVLCLTTTLAFANQLCYKAETQVDEDTGVMSEQGVHVTYKHRGKVKSKFIPGESFTKAGVDVCVCGTTTVTELQKDGACPPKKITKNNIRVVPP